MGGGAASLQIKKWPARARSGAMRERGAVLMTAAAVWPRSTSAKVARRAPLLLELRHGGRHAAKCARGGAARILSFCTIGDLAV